VGDEVPAVWLVEPPDVISAAFQCSRQLGFVSLLAVAQGIPRAIDACRSQEAKNQERNQPLPRLFCGAGHGLSEQGIVNNE
jgi:hypothetical protein